MFAKENIFDFQIRRSEWNSALSVAATIDLNAESGEWDEQQ